MTKYRVVWTFELDCPDAAEAITVLHQQLEAGSALLVEQVVRPATFEERTP